MKAPISVMYRGNGGFCICEFRSGRTFFEGTLKVIPEDISL